MNAPDRNLDDLDPKLQTVCEQWLNACHSLGLDVFVTVTWRSNSDQNEAFAQGLSNAHAGQSPHNHTLPDGTPYARAFDFLIRDNNGNIIKDGSDKHYADAGRVGKELGLIWGGDWHHPDWDHLELPS